MVIGVIGTALELSPESITTNARPSHIYRSYLNVVAIWIRDEPKTMSAELLFA